MNCAGASVPIRSYAEANRELIASFDRYMQSRGNSPETRRHYIEPITRLVDAIGAQSVVNVERPAIRALFAEWERKGLNPNSIRLYTCAFRAFFRFLNLTGLTRHNPMWLVAYRKLPTRVPVVLTVEQVQKLIAVARDPFERAVVEILYGAGVRISEFTKLRLEDIAWGDPSALRVHKGKGGKDRVTLLGKHAEEAIRAYQEWRPSKHGYLFEAPPRIGVISFHPSSKATKNGSWRVRFYLNRIQREMSLGSIEEIPTKDEARAEFQRWLQNKPGYKPVPARPYHPSAIRDLLNRLAHRAGLPHVHPHALRRAMASHMLQSGGNLRVVQDLLGHERLNTTMRYTHLDIADLQRTYEKAHPHAKGESSNDEKE